MEIGCFSTNSCPILTNGTVLEREFYSRRDGVIGVWVKNVFKKILFGENLTRGATPPFNARQARTISQERNYPRSHGTDF